MTALPAYAELHCLSNFTFLRGASHAEELVVRAKALGYSALAITDECSFAGVVRAHVAAKEHGIKLIIGTEVQIVDGPKLVLLATNRESYGHIAALITRARGRAAKGSYRVTLDDLERNLDHCLVLLIPDLPPSQPSPARGEGVASLGCTNHHTSITLWQKRLQHARYLIQRFPQRAWIAVEFHSGPNDHAQLDALRELSALSGLPLVAAGDVHMHLRSRKPLQDTLTAIRYGITLAEAGHRLQPMGFYSASQLVQDAQRHGVEVRAADVTVSEWECTLEQRDDRAPAVRLGLCMIRGLPQASAQRIVSSRTLQVFENIEHFSKHATLNQGDLQRLAAAGALASLAGHRRNAHWLAAGVQTQSPLLQDASIVETPPQLPAPTEGQNIVADYTSTGLTLGRHPLALLRPRLQRMKIVTAAQLTQFTNGDTVRAAGIVTCRQRPGTASGVVFVTLEDETGYVNVVVWNRIAENQRRELLGARLMGIEGKLQREGDVIHLIARRLTDHTRLLGTLATASRDFH